jgi:hypothetical protein
MNQMGTSQLRVAVLYLICCLGSMGEAQTVKTPTWLSSLGSGTTNFTCSSGTCDLTGQSLYSSFTVSAGATVLNTGSGPLIVRATGTCTINGTVSGNPNSGAGGIPGNGDFGGGGGAGGGGTLAAVNGKTTAVVPGVPIVNGGIGGRAGGGNGGNGVSVVQGQYRMFLSTGGAWPGGGAVGSQGGSNGGAAGLGGTPVIFICQTIEFSGAIDVTGGTGGNATAANTGAGGGGGGGYVVLSAVTYTKNTGTIITKGGTGGNCNGFAGCGTGGNGGSGFSMLWTIK